MALRRVCSLHCLAALRRYRLLSGRINCPRVVVVGLVLEFANHPAETVGTPDSIRLERACVPDRLGAIEENEGPAAVLL